MRDSILTHEEQMSLIGFDKFNVLDKLKVRLKTFKISGSLSLNEYGVVKRKIGDIDIVVGEGIFDNLSDMLGVEVKYSSNYETDERLSEEKESNQSRFTIDGIDVCAFLEENNEESIKVKYILDRVFHVSHPKYSVNAKEFYVDLLKSLDRPLTDSEILRMQKHEQDIKNYEEWRSKQPLVPVFVEPKQFLNITNIKN